MQGHSEFQILWYNLIQDAFNYKYFEKHQITSGNTFKGNHETWKAI